MLMLMLMLMLLQASVTTEMWEEFKFAINPLAGDTKPNPALTAENNALSRASSRLMSKVCNSLSSLLCLTPVP
jgi:hypothetical protein